MRLVHVVPHIAKEASGPTVVGLRLCEKLEILGARNALVGLSDPSSSAPASALTFPRGLGPRRWGRSPALITWLQQQLHTQQIDLLHSHGLWMSINTQSVNAALKAGVPVLVSPHGSMSAWAMRSGSWAKKIAWPVSLKPTLQGIQGLHATALNELEEIRQLGFRQPVALVPLGIELPAIPPAPSDPSGLRTMLFLGRIHPKKGLPILLEAWRRIHSEFPTWRIRVVGPDEGGHLAEVQALVAKWELPRVEFSGPVFGMEKWKVYRDSELFVLPTHSENFAVAVAEALASGIPAMVSHGAPWSHLETQQAGWWVKTEVSAWASCLQEVLRWPPEALRKSGERGRAWMRTAYTWEASAAQLLAAYHYFLGTGDKPDCIVVD